MTPHERALELLALAREDEQAASVLDTAAIGDALVGFHYQQAVEKLLKALLAERVWNSPRHMIWCGSCTWSEQRATISRRSRKIWLC
jgi:hypothetical protein